MCFFSSKIRVFLEIARFILGWHDGEKQTIIPEAFPILESICGKVVVEAHSHFGLKDLGHTLTDWLTSEQQEQNPGVDSRSESCSRVTDIWETEKERIRGGCLTSQPVAWPIFLFAASVYVYVCVEEGYSSCFKCCRVCMDFFMYVWACVSAHMHVIFWACLWLCTFLSFSMGMCLFSLCLEAHKYLLKTALALAFVHVSVRQGCSEVEVAGWMCKHNQCVFMLSVGVATSLSLTLSLALLLSCTDAILWSSVALGAA